MSGAILGTERLCLRPRRPDDLEANLAMDLDPEVGRYIFGDAPPDPATRRQQLRWQYESGWPKTGGIWVVEWQNQAGYLGWCGLFPLEHSGLTEIGYRYVRAAWGRGIATEAATAVLRLGFEALRLDPIVAVAHPENARSRRVLEKIGLRAQGHAFHYGQDLAFYRLSREDYLAAPDGQPIPSGPRRTP